MRKQRDFQYRYKRDFQLYPGVRGDWVHAWHLWPRGAPDLNLWLEIASDATVDLFKLRSEICSERKREGIEWDWSGGTWHFRHGSRDDLRCRGRLEMWSKREKSDWVKLLTMECEADAKPTLLLKNR